jgi:phage/plasmid primase-like uncharacterized protein
MADRRQPARRVSPEEIDRLNREADLADMVRRSGVELRLKGGELHGRCPVHGGTSFRVIPAKRFAHCHGCGRSWDPIGWLIDVHGRTFIEAVRELGGELELEPSEEARQAHARAEELEQRERERQQAKKRKAAWRAWGEAVPIAGTPAAAYLVGRGLDGPFPGSLRFHAGLTCRYETDDGQAHSRKLPALVAAVQGGDGRFATIHRIYLDVAADGSATKAAGIPADDVKKLHGSPLDGAIRLGGDPANGLHLAEGVETALAVREVVPADQAVWSVISAGQLLRVAIGRPAFVWVWADHDRPKWNEQRQIMLPPTGQTKAGEAVERWRAAGIKAAWRCPIGPGDWLDVRVAEKRPAFGTG